MPKNLAENMASERPICECGHGPTFHHNPIGYCEHTCACSDYRPAPAATTPERDAMPLSEAIEELRIRANQERYLERRRQRDGQDNTGARVVRAIDTVLAALTPRDEPAAATDGETMCITIEKFPRCHWHSDCPDRPGSGVLRIVCDDTVSKTTLFECQNCGKRGYLPYGAPFDVPQKVAVESSARRADPPPAVVRRIEEACPFCREPITTERGYVVVQNEDTKEPESCCLLCWTDMKDGAMEAELGREG
jgi:hypothetical protein